MTLVSRPSLLPALFVTLLVVGCRSPIPKREAHKIPPLVDPPTSEQHPGKFVWSDLFTYEPTSLSNFYTNLFGWQAETFGEGGEAYVLLSNQGRPVAGIARNLAPPQGNVTTSARWVGYIAVDKLRRTLRSVRRSDGTVLVKPRRIPDRGKIAIVSDNEGSIIGLLKSSSGDPEDRIAEVGDWIWAQVISPNPTQVLPFYRNVFDYEESEDRRTEREDDFLLASEGYARIGLTPQAGEGDSRGGWLGFVRCEDARETASLAEELGGTIISPPYHDPSTGMIAIIADPLGGAIGLYSFDPDQAYENPLQVE